MILRTPESPLRGEYTAKGWWRPSGTYVADFHDQALRQPSKLAIVSRRASDERTREITYGDLAAAVNSCAAGLLRLGVQRGEPVSVQLPNCWQFTALVLACGQIGAVVNPILPIFRAREVGHILRTVGSRVYIAPHTWRDVDYYAQVTALLGQLPSLEHIRLLDPQDGLADLSLEHLLRTSVAPGDAPGVIDPDEAAELQFTSGTTGAPKGVLHTFNTLYRSCRAIIDPLGLTSNDVIHAPSTMAHQTAFISGCIMAMSAGMTAVYQDVWDAAVMIDLIERYGITYTSGSTPFIVDLISAAGDGRHDLSSLRLFKSGGSAVPCSVQRQLLEVTGARVVMSWGMTENGVCTIASPCACRTGNAYDGRPLPWVEVKITDSAHRPLPAGSSGLLWVKTPSQCVDYVPDHALYEESFDRDGWFNTGDLARFEPGGFLHITGRVKDLIIRGGENIPVAEVEAALMSWPPASEVAVVGVPDERLGEQGCAVIVPRAADSERTDLAAMRAHLAELGMAKQYWPEHLIVVAELPRTAIGKISRADLKTYAARQLGRAQQEWARE